jgi:PAS domain S-box-containing protein
MNGAGKTTKTKTAEPAVVPFVLTATQTQNPPVNAAEPAKKTVPPRSATTITPVVGDVAVLALGEAGEILAARDACHAVFGWEPTALVGQNIRVLLKGGLDNDVGRFLHRHRAGTNPTGSSALRVLAVRKDGSELPVQVTTLTWNWDTKVKKKTDTSRLCWTAAFRDLSMEAKSAQQPAADLRSPAKVAPGKSEPVLPGPAAAPPLVPPLPNAPQEPTGQKDGVAAEQVVVFELKQRIQELHEELSKTTGELAGARTEAEKLGCKEAELRAELDAAKEAVGYAEAALREETSRREKLEERLQNLSNNLKQEQAERSKRFEEELVGLRQERDELNNRLAAEQQGTGESTKRAEELEARLNRNAAEFERAKAELEKQTVEREQAESTWRAQFDTVWIAKKELEGACAGAVERNKRVEEELAKLRQEHEELNQKLEAEQKAAADSKHRAQELAGRLSRNAADSDRARTGLEKENAERERVDAEWRKQLDAANALKTRLETSLAEVTEQNKRFEEEVTVLRQERDALQKRTKTGQQTAGESSQRADELQRRLEQNAAELERLAADLEKQSAERERAEARGREQQEAAKALARKLEEDWAGAVERNVRFEEELVELRRDRDELAIQLKAERQASADATHRAGELERRLERNTTELKRVSAEAERQRSEQERADSEWREQLEAAKALARKLDAAWTGATERNRRVEGEAVELRQEREELLGKLAAAHRDAADSKSRADDLEGRINQMTAELERVTGELEKRRAEGASSDSERRTQTEAPTPVLRRDLNQRNGHVASKPESSGALKPASQAKPADHPVQNAAEPERAQPEPDRTAPRLPGDVQQYNFDNPFSKPAARETSSPRKRRQP